MSSLTHKLVNSPFDSCGFLWRKTHVETAKRIKDNADIYHTRPNKVTHVIVLNRSMETKMEIKTQMRLLKLYKSKLISKETYERICPRDQRCVVCTKFIKQIFRWGRFFLCLAQNSMNWLSGPLSCWIQFCGFILVAVLRIPFNLGQWCVSCLVALTMSR